MLCRQVSCPRAGKLVLPQLKRVARFQVVSQRGETQGKYSRAGFIRSRKTRPRSPPTSTTTASPVGVCVRAQTDSSSSSSGEARITAQFSRSKPVKKEDGQLDNWTPSMPGVYAIFNENQELQYVGLSRKISASVERHAEIEDQFEQMHSVQVLPMPGAGKQGLQGVWTNWIETYVEETGEIPVGNKQGEGQWLLRDKGPAKEDIKLTPGKGEEDLSMSLEQLIDSLVKTKRVVAFIKGTRTAPECGFSHQVLHLLNQSKVEYETVNVLDVIHNPGLREAIKIYSDWPTIPQVYVDGEFIGGADIIIEMGENGELVNALQPKESS